MKKKYVAGSYQPLFLSIEIMNFILTDKKSFLLIFYQISNRFVECALKEMNKEVVSLDENIFYNAIKNYPNIQIMILDRDFNLCAESYPTSAEVTIVFSNWLVLLTSPSQFNPRFIFVFITLLHELCHILTPILNEIIGREKLAKTPEIMGQIITVHKDQLSSDFGYEFEEQLLFGFIGILDQTNILSLSILQIHERMEVASGANIIRRIIPNDNINNVSTLILNWLNTKKALSRCFCGFFPFLGPEFPLSDLIENIKYNEKFSISRILNPSAIILDEEPDYPMELKKDRIHLGTTPPSGDYQEKINEPIRILQR